MSDWTGGYISDIGYTYGYYNELSPQRIKLAFLNAGIAPPETINACELGFGQGISINIHAAASSTTWHGTDFNPSQASYALDLAVASGSKAQLFDDAFAEFCDRSELPQFDFIGLHGIWSWISEENRHVIVDFVRRKLNVGGVLYISYNTQPGWAAVAPLRDLLAEHAELMGAPGHGVLPRIDAALEFVEKVLDSGARYGLNNPQVSARLAALKKQNRNYLAHEYFNRDWMPMSFSKMKTWLDDAKLTFACSATMLEHVDVLNLQGEQQQILKDIPDRAFRETVRDFLVNQQFRRDYWVRGMRTMSSAERIDKLRRQRFVMVVPRDEIELKVDSVVGKATLHENIYKPILDLLGDYRIHSLQDVELVLKEVSDFNGALQALIILVGKGCVSMAQNDVEINAASAACNRLNGELCSQARQSSAVSVLASPVTGGGITATRFDQIFLFASKDTANDPAAWARYLIKSLAKQGERMLIGGVLPESVDAESNEALRLAHDFLAKRLPLLRALRVQA